MKIAKFIRLLAELGEAGIGKSDVKPWKQCLRRALRMRLLEQVGLGTDRRYRLIDENIVDTLAPDEAENVRNVSAQEQSEHASDSIDGRDRE